MIIREYRRNCRNDPTAPVGINLFAHASGRQSRTQGGSKGISVCSCRDRRTSRLAVARRNSEKDEFLLTPGVLLLLLDSSSSSSSAPLPSSFFILFLASSPLLFARLFVCSVSFRPVKRDLINFHSLISPPSPLQAY